VSLACEALARVCCIAASSVLLPQIFPSLLVYYPVRSTGDRLSTRYYKAKHDAAARHCEFPAGFERPFDAVRHAPENTMLQSRYFRIELSWCQPRDLHQIR
jgi:hypothetical protein